MIRVLIPLPQQLLQLQNTSYNKKNDFINLKHFKFIKREVNNNIVIIMTDSKNNNNIVTPAMLDWKRLIPGFETVCANNGKEKVVKLLNDLRAKLFQMRKEYATVLYWDKSPHIEKKALDVVMPYSLYRHKDTKFITVDSKYHNVSLEELLKVYDSNSFDVLYWTYDASTVIGKNNKNTMCDIEPGSKWDNILKTLDNIVPVSSPFLQAVAVIESQKTFEKYGVILWPGKRCVGSFVHSGDEAGNNKSVTRHKSAHWSDFLEESIDSVTNHMDYYRPSYDGSKCNRVISYNCVEPTIEDDLFFLKKDNNNTITVTSAIDAMKL